MNIQKIKLVNRSPDQNINIYIGSPEDANLPEFSSSTNIKNNSELDLAYQNATANLFVWLTSSEEVLWKGVIPTKTQNSIDIFPEAKKVLFGNIEIPCDFQTVSSFPKKEKSGWVSYTIVLAIIVLIVIFLLLAANKIRK